MDFIQRKWRWWIGIGLSAVFLGLVALPFLLPLGGPPTMPPGALADPNGRFIDLDGETLYYVHEGGPRDAVILIHGFGGSTVSWRETIPQLAQAGYDVYALDLRGFGLSDKGWDADYTHQAQAERVIRLMNALNIPDAHLVGHSMGGNVAAHLALRHPERVRSLILVDAAIVSPGEDSATPLPRAVLELPFIRRWARLGLRQILAPRFTDLLLDAAYQDAIITPELSEAYERALHTPDWDSGLLAIMRDGDQNALPAPVSSLEVPSLIIWGAQDTWVSPAEARQLADAIPNVDHVEIADAGHLPMHETPAVFNRALLDFLAAVTLPVNP